MASEWIKVTKNLHRKREVLRLCELTGKSRHEVVSLLLLVWFWIDDETEDGRLEGLNVRSLSAIDADICPQFVHGLSEVGWLVENEGGLLVPNFDRHMGASAKRRGLDAKRKQQNRHKLPSVVSCPQSMRTPVREMSQEITTREEKRRYIETPPYPLEGDNSVNLPTPRSQASQDQQPPGDGEIVVASRVVTHYLRVVSPSATANNAVKVVTDLLRAGHTEAQLTKGADLYAAHVARKNTPARSVQGCRRFYGPAGAYLGQFGPAALQVAVQPAVAPPPPPRTSLPQQDPIERARALELLREKRNGIVSPPKPSPVANGGIQPAQTPTE